MTNQQPLKRLGTTAALGGILVGLVALTQLWDSGIPPFRRGLEAELRVTEDVATPEVIAWVEALQRAVPDSALRRVALDHLTRWGSAPNTLWTFEVKNWGSRTLEDVSLTVPGGLAVRISRPGERPVDSPVREVVALGALQPKAWLKVRVWTLETNLSLAGMERATLTHRDGVGRIRLRLPVGKIGQLADAFARPFPLVLATTLLVFLLLAVLEVRIHRRKTGA